MSYLGRPDVLPYVSIKTFSMYEYPSNFGLKKVGYILLWNFGVGYNQFRLVHAADHHGYCLPSQSRCSMFIVDSAFFVLHVEVLIIFLLYEQTLVIVSGIL